MPPPPSSSNFIISKLGVQATVRDDKVTGLICLKVSIPREGEGRQVSRYSLFTGNNPPKLLAPPQVHPLPYTSTPTPGVRTASRLLGLGSSYPPSQAVSGFKPIIDVSSTTGQVFLVLDPRRSSPSKRDSPGGGRRDWLIVLDFEVGVERCVERGSQQVLLGLPKCLDNVIRFQILAPSSSSPADDILEDGGDISIIAEPRVLPVAPDTFAPSPHKIAHRAREIRKHRNVGADEGWEDGEDLGPEEDCESEESEATGEDLDGSAGEEGSWLEGRFPSTDNLRLEWSFGGASTSSSLLITPTYDPRMSTIHVSYETAISAVDGVVPVEAVIPAGWGWRELSIRGEGLVSWRSIDGDWWDDHADAVSAGRTSAPADHSADISSASMDDSFSTVRQRRNVTPIRGHSTPTGLGNPAASLLRQTLPSMGKMEEFSFEMSNSSIETAKPTTPTPTSMSTPRAGSRRSTPSPAQYAVSQQGPEPVAAEPHTRRPLRGPAPATLFDLEYDEEGGSLLFEGTLIPISKSTLVSTGLPLAVPFVRVEAAYELGRVCEVQCRGRMGGSTAEMNLEKGDVGRFKWTDAEAKMLPDERTRIHGEVEVWMVRDVWGGVSVRTAFDWPKRAREVGWTVPSPDVRVTRVAQRRSVLPWAASEVDGQTEVRVGRGDRGGSGVENGHVEVEYEVRMEGVTVPVPLFKSEGQLTVHLKGDWSIDKAQIQTNMARSASDDHTFTFDLSLPGAPSLSINTTNMSSTVARTRTGGWNSWTTFAFIMLFYLLMSLAQRVQRFRAEVAFVANEIKDIRQYGAGDSSALESVLAAAAASASAAALAASSSAAAASGSAISASTPASLSYAGEAAPKDTPWTGRGEVAKRRPAGAGHGGGMNTSLGRVVFGRSAWDKWSAHPTVQSIGRGFSWIWHAVVWLVVAPQ